MLDYSSIVLVLKLLKNNLASCINLGIGGFDTHANQTRLLQPILTNVDHLLSVFISQLKLANQLDNTLIVVFSDFGRTPRVNGRSGRDHWPVGGSLLIGGGLSGGRAVGGTDDDVLAQFVNFQSGAVDANGEQLNPTHLGGSILDLTLGASYLDYRSYLTTVPSLVQLKG